MSTPYRIMTVCTGNICRSPMAEVVLRARLASVGLGELVVVDSTAISDEERGNPIDPRARTALVGRGYEVPRHTARQVTATNLATRDLVLAMTSAHARALHRLAPDTTAAGRVVLYRVFDPAAPQVPEGSPEPVLDVDDPWGGGPDAFETCLDELEAAADGIVAHVRRAIVA
ncbi:MAG: low molecular weight protein-tyrosine-phosphatase [Cellulomonas sp.]